MLTGITAVGTLPTKINVGRPERLKPRNDVVNIRVAEPTFPTRHNRLTVAPRTVSDDRDQLRARPLPIVTRTVQRRRGNNAGRLPVRMPLRLRPVALRAMLLKELSAMVERPE